MNEPKIKAVEMVRSIREAHYERIKDLSPKEKIAFFREKARALHAELGDLRSFRRTLRLPRRQSRWCPMQVQRPNR